MQGRIGQNRAESAGSELPYQKWAADVTEFSLFGEKLYLSPVPDLHSSDPVSCTISDRLVLSMAASVLDRAFEKIADGTGRILHSKTSGSRQNARACRLLCADSKPFRLLEQFKPEIFA